MADKKNDQEPQAPESAADVIKDAQKELGKTRDLDEAPVTPELVDAKNRLVEAANQARTIAQAVYPAMRYDPEGKQQPRIVHGEEEDEALGWDEEPANPTEHGRGDSAEEQQLRRMAEQQARVELEKESIKAEKEQQREDAEKARGKGNGDRRGKK